MNIKGVIFDMDGLMFDTENLSVGLWKKVGEQNGYDININFLEKVLGTNSEICRRLFTEEYGENFDYEDLSNKKRLLMIESINKNGVPIKKGLIELLSFLKKNGIKIALATSTSEKHAKPYLDGAGVTEYFDVKVFGNMVKKSKPEPDIFLKAMDLMGVNADECLILEDSFNGIKAAHAAKSHAVMIPDLKQPNAEIKTLLFRKCGSLSEVIEVILDVSELVLDMADIVT